MQSFTPRPVNQAGAQGEEAAKGIANGGARQRRRRGKMHSDGAYRVAGSLGEDEMMILCYDRMLRTMRISVLSSET